MWKVASAVLALVVSLVLVDNLSAQQGRGRGGRDRGPGSMSMIDRVERNKDLKLTDDQKAKLADLKKEYAPKLKEANEKLDGVLTDEQKKARDAAMKAAREAGQRGQEVRDAVNAAMKLTDEQKAKRADIRKTIAALNKEISDKVTGLLTTEQQDVLKKARGNRGNGGRRGGGRQVN
jgi:Spy/CpxP family protein refolding chaperone